MVPQGPKSSDQHLISALSHNGRRHESLEEWQKEEQERTYNGDDDEIDGGGCSRGGEPSTSFHQRDKRKRDKATKTERGQI